MKELNRLIIVLILILIQWFFKIYVYFAIFHNIGNLLNSKSVSKYLCQINLVIFPFQLVIRISYF